jgi:diacylglycerol kinase family enzyme
LTDPAAGGEGSPFAPSRRPASGSGLAVLVNANAKRGGRRVAVQIARALPGASVRLTRTKEEIDAWLRQLPAPRAVLAAGGDGTAVALVNALARVTPEAEPFPPLGILPLGTGNGWAHPLGAPKLHRCMKLLSSSGAIPTRACGLIEADGTLAHFAGSGWDAMILQDYERQLEGSRGPGRRLSKSVYGYVMATLLRTAPKVLVSGNPHVLIENLGSEVYEVDEAGRPRRLDGAGRGAILYDGPAGTASASTCTDFGYRFRAFPFAERMPGFMSLRVYDRSALAAIASSPQLWRGAHPLRGMHDWFATHVRLTFSRNVPFQIGGDAHGERRTVDLRASPRAVRMIDWRRLLACSVDSSAT